MKERRVEKDTHINLNLIWEAAEGVFSTSLNLLGVACPCHEKDGVWIAIKILEC